MWCRRSRRGRAEEIRGQGIGTCLEARCGVEEAAEVGPQVAGAGVPKQVRLRLAAAAGVDVGLQTCGPPAHQRVRHVAEQLRAQLAGGKPRVPDLALHA